MGPSMKGSSHITTIIINYCSWSVRKQFHMASTRMSCKYTTSLNIQNALYVESHSLGVPCLKNAVGLAESRDELCIKVINNNNNKSSLHSVNFQRR